MYPLAIAVRTECVEVRTFVACDELSRAFDGLSTNGWERASAFLAMQD